MIDGAARLLQRHGVDVHPRHQHVPVPEEQAAVVDDHGQGVRLFPGRAAGGEDLERPVAARGLPLLEALEHGVGKDLELGHLPVEVGLVVREMGRHPVALLGVLGAEAQVVVVVLEGREAEGGQPAGQPRPQRPALAVVEEQPELLVDEVPQQAELLLRQLDVVVRRMEHYRGVSFFRAWAAAWRTCGEGSEAFRSMSGRTASRKRAVAEGQRRFRAHLRGVVGEGGQQQLAALAVLQLAHQGDQQPPHRGGGDRERALHLRQRGHPDGAQGFERRRLQRRVVKRGDEPARGPRVADLAQRGHRGAADRRVLVGQPGQERRGRLDAADAPERGGGGAAHAPVLVLQRQQQRGNRLGIADDAEALRGDPAQVAVRLRQHADQRADGGGRAHGAQRLGGGEAQLLALVGEERDHPVHHLGVPDLSQRAQGHEPHAGIGVFQQRGEVAGGLRLLQLAEGLHGLLPHQRRLVHEGGAQQVGDSRGVDLPQRLDGGAAHRLPRVLGQRDERGGGVGLPQPAQRLRGADAHRHLGAGQRLQQQRGHALRAHADQGAHRAVLDELAVVAEQLEQHHRRVLVPQAAHRRHRLRAHLLRRVVDERRDEVDPARRRDPGQAADGPLPHRVLGVVEPERVGGEVPAADGDEGVGRVLLQRGIAQELR